MKIQEQDIKDCINFYQTRGISSYATRDNQGVVLELSDYETCAELSKRDIMVKARIHRDELREYIEKSIEAGDIAEFEDLLNTNDFRGFSDDELLEIQGMLEAQITTGDDFIGVFDARFGNFQRGQR